MVCAGLPVIDPVPALAGTCKVSPGSVGGWEKMAGLKDILEMGRRHF